MMRKISFMAFAMTFLFIACTKVGDQDGTFTNQQVGYRAPNGSTPPFPTAFEDWYYGDNQIRFCDGVGWNCWPSLDPDLGPYWISNLPQTISWPLTDPGDNSGQMVDLQWETDASLKMHILSPFPSYDEVLESAGGDEAAAQWAYDLMRERVNVPLPVVLDPAICEMLFEDYAGQGIQLMPGEYSIRYNSDNIGEVIIPVEIY